jgi:hypothetical protein
MLAVAGAARLLDGISPGSTLEDMKKLYVKNSGFNPIRDVVIAESDGHIVGYARGWCRSTIAQSGRSTSKCLPPIGACTRCRRGLRDVVKVQFVSARTVAGSFADGNQPHCRAMTDLISTNLATLKPGDYAGTQNLSLYGNDGAGAVLPKPWSHPVCKRKSLQACVSLLWRSIATTLLALPISFI